MALVNNLAPATKKRKAESSSVNSFETLVRNYSPKSYREETLNGRKYIVSPVTMIVPGVLNGSKGRLYYPLEEIGKDPTPWNDVPLTWYHPVRNGRQVSAKEPGIVDSQGIGFVKKATTGNKLKAEAWIDVAKANRLDPRIVRSVLNSEPMEISTGLYTDNQPAPDGSHFNGKRYDFIARNYRPDHLAILPDQTGACSLRDGCGLGINAGNNPTGINQYTKGAHTASSDAHLLSKKTTTKGRGYSEQSVSRAKKAIQSSEFGNSPREHHRQTAKYHLRAAKEHKTVQLSGKLSSSESMKHGQAKKAHVEAYRAHLKASRDGQTTNEFIEMITSNDFSPEARQQALLKRKQRSMSKGKPSIRQRRIQQTVKPKQDEMIAKRKQRDSEAAVEGKKKTQEGAARTDTKDKALRERVETRKKEFAAMNVRYFLTDNRSHEETRQKVDQALRGKLTQNDPTPYITEVHDDHVKYQHGGQMMKCNYKDDGESVRLGKPKALKAKTIYEAVEPDGDEPMEMNSTTEGSQQRLSPNSTRKGGTMAKLTANQRSAVIDGLVSNEGCGCFNEEDRNYLEGLSDKRLSVLQRKQEEHLASNSEEDPDEDDDEGSDLVDKEPVVKNQKTKTPRRMTVNEFRETAPLEFVEAVDEATAVVNEKKTEIIGRLTKHLKDGDVKTRLVANLQKRSLSELRDQMLLTPPQAAPEKSALRPVFGPTGNQVSMTDDPVSNDDDDVASMTIPKIDYAELSKANDSRHRYANNN